MNWYAISVGRAFATLRSGDSKVVSGDGSGMMFADRHSASEWLESERTNLLALISQATGEPGVPSEILMALRAAVESER
jgi:hypothetical protein